MRGILALDAVPGHFEYFLGAAWEHLRPQTDLNRVDGFPRLDVCLVRSRRGSPVSARGESDAGFLERACVHFRSGDYRRYFLPP